MMDPKNSSLQFNQPLDLNINNQELMHQNSEKAQQVFASAQAA